MQKTHRQQALEDWDQIPPEKQVQKKKDTWLGAVYVVAGIALALAGGVLLFTDDEPAKWFILLIGIGLALAVFGGTLISRDAMSAGRKVLGGTLKDAADAWKARK